MRLILPLLAVMLMSTVLAAEVSLTVPNHSGAALKAAPVRGGVPFALGQVKGNETFQLADAAGKQVPCRVRSIARWHDGSVKWLLVDTQVDLPAEGAAHLRLSTGAAACEPAQLVKCSESPTAITVETGAARFVFSKKQFGLPTEAWIGKTQVIAPGSQFVCEVEHTPAGPPEEEDWLRPASGSAREKFTAAPAGEYRVEVENANDLRVTVKLSGWLVNPAGRKLIQYVIRAQACAGKADLKLSPTFVYAGKPKEDFIRAMYLRFPRKAAGAATWTLGGETPHEGRLSGQDAVSLYEIGPQKIYHMAPYDQDKTVTYSVVQNGKQLATGKEAAGWAQVSDGAGTLGLALRDFWKMHPKEIKCEREALTLYLWPEQGNKVLDLRRRYDEIENTYHYDLSLWEFGGEGVGVTHDVMLTMGVANGGTAEAAPLRETTALLNNPLMLQCEPAYYAATGVFGPFAPVNEARYPHLEAYQKVATKWIRRNQEQFHWDGMIDRGDTLFHGYATPSHYGYLNKKGWCSRGYVGWLNDDGGLTNSLFLHYARSGDYDVFRLAENMARHSMDVDTCHYCAERPGEVGGGHRHDQQHWGNGCRGYGTATHGIIDYYLLTGNERALDVARETSGYHDNGVPSEDEDRIGGLIRFWEISGEEHWKQRADQLLAEELNVPAENPWRFVTTQHFRMVSNTCTGFMYYLSAAPPQDCAKLKEAIVKTVDGRYDTWRSSWDEAGYLAILLSSLAYQATGDRKYAEATAVLVQRAGVPSKVELTPGYLQTLDAMPWEDFVQAVTGKWGVNNVYMLTIQGLVPLPYALAVFERAGMDQQAVLAVPRVTNEPPPFEEILDPQKMRKEIGFAYQVSFEHGCPSDQGGGVSKLVLLEDGKPLGPKNSPHAVIRTDGGGRYSHWGARTLWFSTSDNSDPRTNGRQYKVVYPGPR
ncbi:MAG: hypothetical protein ABFE08_10445 [Armatimonadia bacterium]